MQNIPSIEHEKTITRFEINLAVRDAKGNLTGKRKSLKTDDANELFMFWKRHQGLKRKKNKKVEKSALPKGKEATSLLNQSAEYAEKVREKFMNKNKDSNKDQ